jgi:hypothetical protein
MVLDILGSGRFRPNFDGHLQNWPVFIVLTWLDLQFSWCVLTLGQVHIKAHRLMILLCKRKDPPMIVHAHIYVAGRSNEGQYWRIHVIDGSRENPVETHQADKNIEGGNGKKSHENVGFLSSR